MKWSLKHSHHKVVHVLALDGQPDFEHKGYWTSSHTCRPAELVITHERLTQGDADEPGEWTLHLLLKVRWVRKDGTVSDEANFREVHAVLPEQETWRGGTLIAPNWMVGLVNLFGPEYDPRDWWGM